MRVSIVCLLSNFLENSDLDRLDQTILKLPNNTRVATCRRKVMGKKISPGQGILKKMLGDYGHRGRQGCGDLEGTIGVGI